MAVCKNSVWFGWHLGIAACHILSSVQDGGGASLCIEVERTGNEQPGFAEHPPWANLEWWEECDAAGTPVLETKHFPYLRQAQVAAEALAARKTDGGGRGGFHWGTSTGRVHFICIGFVLNPQTLLCPSPYTQSCSVQMILSNPTQAMEMQRPRILCCPLTWFKEYISPFCNKLLLPSLLLLTYEFIKVITPLRCLTISFYFPGLFVKPVSSFHFSCLFLKARARSANAIL